MTGPGSPRLAPGGPGIEPRWSRLFYLSLRGRYDTLSPRERDVMEFVVAGGLNKQVGGKLGISEITVKAHRGRVM